MILPPGEVREGPLERDFFRENTPIPAQEVFESISLVYHGIVPAVADGDLSSLRKTLAPLHQVGFKARELAAQSTTTRSAYNFMLCNTDNPVGMSSLGPLLYVISGPADTKIVSELSMRAVSEFGGSYLGSFTGNNNGYVIQQ